MCTAREGYSSAHSSHIKPHPENSIQTEFLPLITGSSTTTHSLLLPGEQKPFCQVNGTSQSSRSIPKSLPHLEGAEAQNQSSGQIPEPSLLICAPVKAALPTQILNGHNPGEIMGFIPQTLTPAPNDQDFITCYLKGVCPTQWEG